MDGWALLTAIGLLAAFAGLSAAVRRGVRGPVRAQGTLTLRRRVPVAPGVEVLVVGVGDRRLLLASDAGGVRLLRELEGPPPAGAPEAG